MSPHLCANELAFCLKYHLEPNEKHSQFQDQAAEIILMLTSKYINWVFVFIIHTLLKNK